MSHPLFQIGKPLPVWTEGFLDLHHINTGRGNCAFYRLPDGTTMLVDAGELDPTTERVRSPRNAPARPDDTRPPHEWIVAYIKQMCPNPHIDYAWLTHFHEDHMGCVTERAQASSTGPYKLTGMTGVGDLISFHTLIDRDYPDYQYPLPIEHPKIVSAYGNHPEYKKTRDTFQNYRTFIQHHQKQNGMSVQKFVPGVKNQFILKKHPNDYPTFEIRNICGNGHVWTGVDTVTRQHLPDIEHLPLEHLPDENILSCGIRLCYGKFTFFNGADIPGVPGIGAPAWRDLETPVAQVVGPVDVHVLNHHGYRDTHNTYFVQTLRPRVYIQQNWSSDQPGHDVFSRLTSTYLYPGPRDLFTTDMLEANRMVIGPALDRAYKSMRGHIVVRVVPGGSQYYVIILDDTGFDRLITGIHGPYESR